MENLKREAAENLRRLAENTYPGRGIVLGRSADARHLVQLYWIMGRSAHSQNRRFVKAGPTLRTEPLDPAKVEDPSLVIYTAMREAGGHFLVSNGSHTDALAECAAAGQDFREALRRFSHEPDDPNWTPRIAGGMRVGGSGPGAWLALLKADPFNAGRTLRFFYEFDEIEPGFGWCLTTYRSDGTPLPPFTGEPMLIPLRGGGTGTAQETWNLLNEKNRVALALKLIDPEAGKSALTLINRFERP